MGINLTEISQKVLDTVGNAANVFRKMYDLHYNPDPMEVELEYIDENGNKRTTRVPNRSKIAGDFERWKDEFFWNGNLVAGNLIDNAFMSRVTDGKPDGFGTRGDVVIEAVHPYTKAFEGPYTETKPSNAVDDPEQATQDAPYWFGRYNKGPRIWRGGLADGWGCICDGHILKITKPANSSTDGFNSVTFPFKKRAIVDLVIFSAYIKIVKGSRIGFGTDSGYMGTPRGHIVTRDETLNAPQGWHRVAAVIGTSNNNISSSNFLLGFEASEEVEVYLALPSAFIVPRNGYRMNITE